jgi:hypothetical protein
LQSILAKFRAFNQERMADDIGPDSRPILHQRQHNVRAAQSPAPKSPTKPMTGSLKRRY